MAQSRESLEQNARDQALIAEILKKYAGQWDGDWAGVDTNLLKLQNQLGENSANTLASLGWQEYIQGAFPAEYAAFVDAPYSPASPTDTATPADSSPESSVADARLSIVAAALAGPVSGVMGPKKPGFFASMFGKTPPGHVPAPAQHTSRVALQKAQAASVAAAVQLVQAPAQAEGISEFYNKNKAGWFSSWKSPTPACNAIMIFMDAVVQSIAERYSKQDASLAGKAKTYDQDQAEQNRILSGALVFIAEQVGQLQDRNLLTAIHEMQKIYQSKTDGPEVCTPAFQKHLAIISKETIKFSAYEAAIKEIFSIKAEPKFYRAVSAVADENKQVEAFRSAIGKDAAKGAQLLKTEAQLRPS